MTVQQETDVQKIREETDTESDEEELFSEEEEEEYDEILRMKWIGDGSKNLDELIEKLKQEISFIQRLKEDGYELISPMCDDYGFIKKRKQTVIEVEDA